MLDLQELQARALDELANADSQEALEQWRHAYLGRTGELTLALRSIGQLPAEERPAAGQQANQVRQALTEGFEVRQAAVNEAAMAATLATDALDVRLPGRPQTLGHVHVITQVLRDIYGIFRQMGFSVFQTREVEDDTTNFQLLNMPPDHPARDMWSTFYATTPGVLLRTHTSPGQIHAMRQFYPDPFRVILPGKCYRYEQVTTRSEHMFHQVEGLAIGQNITIADLKGVLEHFARQMFGPERKLRFRASYFPFTEPSAECDVDCSICGGAGCQLCKHSGWLEILGGGMVHPEVLRNGGYDPDVYSGFAFGMGPERLALLKYGINDIRLFYANDLRFLQQFG
ncbi:MAG: phenylalanine--tRNA ligase subunit alpha [Anaerolineae bacterium]|jgi:phenylalanyl-tRNA synthetase alpha chain|nr:phenylalanine--tRNA ligase subunit alpha [Chloroflexota bacterium]